MKSKKELLRQSSLYVIIDKEASKNRPILNIARSLVNHRVDIIQLRDKKSSTDILLKEAWGLKRLLAGQGPLLIINDYLDIAKIVDSDGVHLGQDDLSVEIARRILGKDKIIGVSCRSVKEAKIAQANGADYIGIGPVFPTPTKPEAKAIGLNSLIQISKQIKIPFFPIGGMNMGSMSEMASCGVGRVAVCSAVCQARNVSLAAERLAGLLN